MKRLQLILVLALFAGVWAQATPQPNSYGSYCSAYTRTGEWAVWFGRNGISDSCATVQQVLGYAPVVQRRTGYYSLYGWNQVRVRCLNYRNTFFGTGAQPARQAYDAANWANGQRCLFSVRH